MLNCSRLFIVSTDENWDECFFKIEKGLINKKIRVFIIMLFFLGS